MLIRYAELKDPESFREVDAFLPGLPPDLRRKISAYKFAKDAQLCLEGRIGAAKWFLTPLHFGNNYSAHLATAWQPAATEIQIAKSEFHP